MVFACTFLGLSLEKVSGPALQTYFLAGTIHELQVVVGLTLTAVIIKLAMPDLFFGSGLLPVTAFYGGHGGSVPAGLLWADAGVMSDANQLGMTYATIGLLTGIVGGMMIIKRAARKGITTTKMKLEDLPQSVLTGYIPPEERTALGNGVSSPETLDPLASQLMLVGLIIFVANIIRNIVIGFIPAIGNAIGLFAWCMVTSLLFNVATRKSKKINSMIDRNTIVRISGTALDYLIVASIATTSLDLFIVYALPLVVLSIATIVVTYWACFWLGKYVLAPNGRFETSIGLFGQTTGVLPTGLMLLKVVDPNYKTDGATNITMSSTLGYTYQLTYIMIFYGLIITMPRFVYWFSVFLLALFMALGVIFGRRYQNKPGSAATGVSGS